MVRAFAVQGLIAAGIATGLAGAVSACSSSQGTEAVGTDRSALEGNGCPWDERATDNGFCPHPVTCQPACVPGVNPHGANIPPANGFTFPGGSSHDDGFFQIGCGVAEVDVIDLGTGTIFGPYPSGTYIKYTQAPGAQPTAKAIGSSNGQADAVTVHITGEGDAEIVQAPAGSSTSAALCLVPPPPK
jgi:hypothetical protein